MRIPLFFLLLLWLVHPPGYVDAQSSSPGMPEEVFSANPWTSASQGLDADSVWALVANPDGVLFAGTENGVFRSFDEGDTWEAASMGLAGSDVGALSTDPLGILYAATHGGGVYRSLDDGDTWESINAGLPDMRVGDVATDADGVLYAGVFLGGVFQSFDEGDTWEEANDAGLDNPFVPSLAVNVDGIVFHGSDAGVFRSLDGGETWESANSGLGNLFVEALVVSRDDVLFAGTDAGVFRSLDDGDSWEAVHDTTLAERTVRSLVTNENFALFAGTHGGGVFRSLNHGANWVAVNEGLTNLDVSALAVAFDGALLAGTVGGGIFRRDAATDVSNETDESLPAAFELDANYPNPFNPTTLIRYALPVQSFVELAVFDASGRRIAVLVDRELAAGRHEIAFDAAQLPSGVYFYRLDAGSFSEVKQMVLLR